MKRAISAFLMGFTVLGCGIAALGCSGAADVDEPLDLETMAADSRYMRNLAEKGGGEGAVKIDLADDRQFGFLRNRLRGNGIDPESAPRVFEGLQLARDKAIAIKTGKVHPSVAAASATSQDRCGMYIVSERLDATKFSSLARGSCIGGATYSYVDQYQYDQNWNMLSYDYKEEWNKGIAADVKLSTVPPSNKAVFAEGIVYHETTTTVEAYYYVTSTYTNHLPDPASAKDPGSGGVQSIKAPTVQNDVMYPATAPKDVNGNGTILLCLERNTSSSDCDYKHATTGACGGTSLCELNTPKFPIDTATYDDNKLYMPLEGKSLPAHGPSSSSSNPWAIKSAKAWLTMRTAGGNTPAGGFCKKEMTGNPKIRLAEAIVALQRKMQVIIDPFAVSLGNATWPDHCVDHGRQVDLDVEVVIYQPNNNAAPSDKVFNWTTRAFEGAPSVPPMSVYWGCLPTGTEISLADGKRAPIDQIAIGQKVVSDDHGRALTVVDIVEGSERRPLVRVADDRGNVVTMTTTHAVPLANAHVVQAQEMQVGDRIITKDGAATVVSVERLEYEGPVYNLILGTAEELGAVSKDGTTMFANGVLVGDSRLQGAITQLRADEAAQARRMAALPEAFKADYQMSLSREQRHAAKR